VTLQGENTRIIPRNRGPQPEVWRAHTGPFLIWIDYPHYSDHTTPYGAIRRGNEKLIEFYEDGRLELYDLHKDPGEKHDLAAEHPARARELRQLLADWRKQVGAQMPSAEKDKPRQEP
jgi:hypothetical protein